MKYTQMIRRVLVCLLAFVLAFTSTVGTLAEEVDNTDANISAAYDAMMFAKEKLDAVKAELEKADADVVAASASLAEAEAAMTAAKKAMEEAGLTEDSDIAAEITELTAQKTLLETELQALPTAKQAEITYVDTQITLKQNKIKTQQEKIETQLGLISDAESALAANSSNTTDAENSKATYERLINNANNSLLPTLTAERDALTEQIEKDQAAYDDLEPNIERLRIAAENAEEAEAYYLELQSELEEQQQEEERLQKLYVDAKTALNEQQTLLSKQQEALRQEEKAFPAEKEQLEAEKAAAETAYNEAVQKQEESQKALAKVQAIVNSEEAKNARDDAEDKLNGYDGEIAEIDADILELKNELADIPGKITEKTLEISEQQTKIDEAKNTIAEIESNIEQNKIDTEIAYNNYLAAQQAVTDALAAIEGNEEVVTLSTQISTLTTNINTLNSEIETAQARATELEGLMEDTNTEIETLTTTIDDLEVELEERLTPAKKLAESAYETAKANLNNNNNYLNQFLCNTAKSAYESALQEETEAQNSKKEAETEKTKLEKTYATYESEYNTLTAEETGTIAKKQADVSSYANQMESLEAQRTAAIEALESSDEIKVLKDAEDAAKGIWQNLVDVGNTLRNKTLPGYLAELGEEDDAATENTLYGVLNKLKAELAVLQARPDEIDSEISSLNTQKGLKNLAKKGLDEIINYYDDAVEALPNLKAQLEQDTRDAAAKLTAAEDAEKELQDRIAANTQMQQEVAAQLLVVEEKQADYDAKEAALDAQKIETQEKLDAVKELTQNDTIDYEALKTAAAEALQAAEESLESDKVRLQESIDNNTLLRDGKNDEITDLNTNLETWKQEVAKLNSKLADLATEKTNLENSLASLKAALGKEDDPATTNTLYGVLNKLMAELAELNDQKAKLQDELANIDTSEKALDLKAQIAAIEAQLSDYEGDSKLIADYAAALAAYELADAACSAAKATQLTVSATQIALQLAYDEAYSKYQQLIGSANCAHDDYKVTILGNTYCPLKSLGLCTHNLGVCCTAINVDEVKSGVAALIQSGDYEALAAEVESVYHQAEQILANYNELPESVRNVIESTVKNTVETAVDAAATQLIGDENWASLKDLANTLMDEEQRQALVDELEAQVKAEVQAAVDQLMATEEYAAIKPYVDKALEVIDALKPYWEDFDLTQEEIENIVEQAVTDYLNNVKAAIQEKIDQAIDDSCYDEIVAELEKAMAAIETLKQQIPDASEIVAAAQAFAADIAALVEEKIQPAIEAKIQQIINNYPPEQVQAKVEELLADVKALQEKIAGMDLTKEDLQQYVQNAVSDLAAQAKADVKAAAEAIANSDAYAYITNKAEELQDKLEALMADVHLCEESVEALAQAAEALVTEFVQDATAYIEDKVNSTSCEDVKAKLEAVADAIEAAMNWRPDTDLTEEEVKEILSAVADKAKETVKDAANRAKSFIQDILSHIHVVDEAVAPTCYQPGLTEGLHCICGHVIIAQETIPATGEHMYDNGTTTNATCTEDGKIVYACTTAGCTATKEDVITAPGHSYKTVTVSATCTENGSVTTTCDNCDYNDVQVLTAPGHSYKTVTVNATCTENGSVTTTCDNCDYNDVQVLTAPGHNYKTVTVNATCAANGSVTTTCDHCDYQVVQVLTATGNHIWNEGEVTLAPTHNTEGTMTYTCTTPGCTATKEDKIPVVRVPGDANCDGAFTLADILLCLQKNSGWGVTINESNADVNASGSFTLADILLMLQKNSGWNVTLL